MSKGKKNKTCRVRKRVIQAKVEMERPGQEKGKGRKCVGAFMGEKWAIFRLAWGAVQRPEIP